MERSFFKDVNQPKGEQHLVQMVTVVEMAKQKPFQRQAEHNGASTAPTKIARVQNCRQCADNDQAR
jgi:uncharacterized protein YerC